MTTTHDFDFFTGAWAVHHRKLTDPLDPGCSEWVEFDGTSDATSIMDGAGNVDRLFVPEPADGGVPFEAMTLRLYNPESRTWRIWWTSSRNPGVLDVPVEGTFTDGSGVFECADTLGGKPALVRFEWTTDPHAPQWEQYFSWDDGRTWQLNWVMSFSRN
jgi:hypothetical protein